MREKSTIFHLRRIRIYAVAFAAVLGAVLLIWSMAGKTKEETSAQFYFPVQTKDGILQIPAAEYIAGCAMNADAPAGEETEEYRKALCAAISTNAWYLLQREKALPADAHGMRWSDMESLAKRYSAQELKLWQEAAVWAEDKVVCFGGMPILAAYFSSGFGITESSALAWGKEAAYLTRVKGYDMDAPEGETIFLQEKALAAYLKKLGIKDAGELRIASRSEAGTVVSLYAGEEKLDVAAFAAAFSLPSRVFTIQQKEGGYQLICLGRGDGVGMSLYGAKQMAKAGYDAKQILTHYYKGASLCSLAAQDAQ